MSFDLRLPIGGMFTLFGAILTLYGFVVSPTTYQKSLGINVDLYWGLVLLVFGAVMLTWARLDRRRAQGSRSF